MVLTESYSLRGSLGFPGPLFGLFLLFVVRSCAFKAPSLTGVTAAYIHVLVLPKGGDERASSCAAILHLCEMSCGVQTGDRRACSALCTFPASASSSTTRGPTFWVSLMAKPTGKVHSFSLSVFTGQRLGRCLLALEAT